MKYGKLTRHFKFTSHLKLIFIASLLVSCSDHVIGPPIHGEIGVARPPVSISGNSPAAYAGPTTAVSGGPNALGVSVPTAEAVAGRIANGLEGNAPPNTGNFSQALAQMRSNLPKVSNVNNASGYDQIELLAYAACADLTGSGGKMQSVYGVNAGATIATNQAALISAGKRILDHLTAGLATQGPGSAQVSSVLTNLVLAQAATASNTSTMAFMTVCIAATTAGTTLLGM